jgi:hypothetical protein
MEFQSVSAGTVDIPCECRGMYVTRGENRDTHCSVTAGSSESQTLSVAVDQVDFNIDPSLGVFRCRSLEGSTFGTTTPL